MRMTRALVAVVVGSVLIAATSVTRQARAGSADATLACASKDGGSKLAGTIPRDEGKLDLTLTDPEGRTHTWSSYENLVMFSHVSDHVLLLQTVFGPELSFRALPKTMKVRKRGRHDEAASFEAVAKVPALGDGAEHREIRLTCDYLYEI